MPEEYLGLLHHLHTTDANICSAKSISTNGSVAKTDDHKDELMNYFITNTGKRDLLIAPHIYLHIQKGETPNAKNNIFADRFIGIFHCKITLYSYKITLKQLKTTVTEWTTTYRDYLKDKNKG